MKRTKIAVAGALGRMGTQIIKKINETEDLEVVLAIEIEGCSKKGMDIGEVLGIDKMGINLTTSDKLEDSLKKTNPDVLIDFTTATAAIKNIKIASKRGVNLVIGTTGFSNKQREEIESYITNNKVAAVISPNMSKGVNVFFRMAMIMAEYLKGYDIEIIEKHHRFKRDSPSGTALKVGDLIAEAIGEDLSDKAVYGRKNNPYSHYLWEGSCKFTQYILPKSFEKRSHRLGMRVKRITHNQMCVYVCVSACVCLCM